MYGGQSEHQPRDVLVFSSSATQDNHAGWQSDTPGDTLVLNESEGSDNITTYTATISTTTTSEGGKHDTGLDQPRLQATGKAITSVNKNKMRSENRRRRRALQQAQTTQTLWENHTGTRVLPATAADKSRPAHRNYMCLAGLALTHPAAETLLDWATFGCPTKTGNNWSRQEIEEAIERGPHRSAMTPNAIAHFADVVREKVRTNQARVVEWDMIKDNPPQELKISPIAAIPHKSKAYRSILDLSFWLRLKNGGVREAVNDTTEKTAPGGAIDQIGECLSRIMYAFAEIDEDEKIFMAKWDIKDGFWRMDCRAGEEWNFAYVLPQPPGEPVRLLVPTSLQMGWVESPPYFCTTTETARDVVSEYLDTAIGSRKLENYTTGSNEYASLYWNRDQGSYGTYSRCMSTTSLASSSPHHRNIYVMSHTP